MSSLCVALGVGLSGIFDGLGPLMFRILGVEGRRGLRLHDLGFKFKVA